MLIEELTHSQHKLGGTLDSLGTYRRDQAQP